MHKKAGGANYRLMRIIIILTGTNDTHARIVLAQVLLKSLTGIAGRKMPVMKHGLYFSFSWSACM